MKTKILLFASVVFCCLTMCPSVFAQGTAFTYQGQVMSSNSPAHGTYDLTFKLWNASSGGAQVGGTITAPGTVITNGLFTVVLDFGSVFSGSSYWLELGVRSNGVVSFATLSPRQQLTPEPYAVFAEGGNAAGLTGTMPSSGLSGTYGNALTLNNAGNIFDGNGAGLTGVNALTLGGLGAANFWQLGGNAGTTPGVNYLGTPDNQALEIHVNGARGFRVEPDSIYSTPNVIGGSAANYVAPGWVGNVIGAGGQPGIASTSITGGHLNVIGGGWDNHSTNGIENVIAGGANNTVAGNISSIGGGAYNTVLGYGGTVPGGYNNLASGTYSFAAGQNAQALHDGAFVWADDSSSTPFASTTNNQFLVRASFVGINRATQVSGAEYFGIYAPVTNSWVGMYIQGSNTSRPYYGYNNPLATAWTEMDGTDGNKWKVYNNGYQLTVTPAGLVGIGTTTPGATLEVNGSAQVDGNARITGLVSAGSQTGTSEAPSVSSLGYAGLVTRRINSTDVTAGSIVARTDTMTLERDGSSGGLRVSYVGFPGAITITAMGVNNAGGQVNFYTSLNNPFLAGTVQIYTDAQAVHFTHISFGRPFDDGHLTEVSLTRATSDWFWVGTVTSTVNQ
jgi:hypothetical protein